MYNGSSYIATQTVTNASTPDANPQWSLLASKGDPGGSSPGSSSGVTYAQVSGSLTSVTGTALSPTHLYVVCDKGIAISGGFNISGLEVGDALVSVQAEGNLGFYDYGNPLGEWDLVLVTTRTDAPASVKPYALCVQGMAAAS